MSDYTDQPTVCIAHGRFIPCRTHGEHRYTDNPYWVKSVRDYQGSTIPGLTWEPAWEAAARHCRACGTPTTDNQPCPHCGRRKDMP